MAKILIVDDSQFFRDVYSKVLSDNGFEVETAVNGKIALASMLNTTPDMVFLDLVMPEMNGEEVLRIMHTIDSLKNVPVVMLTSIAPEVKGVEILSAGPLTAYFVKDKTSPEDIVHKTEEVLGNYEHAYDPKENA